MSYEMMKDSNDYKPPEQTFPDGTVLKKVPLMLNLSGGQKGLVECLMGSVNLADESKNWQNHYPDSLVHLIEEKKDGQPRYDHILGVVFADGTIFFEFGIGDHESLEKLAKEHFISPDSKKIGQFELQKELSGDYFLDHFSTISVSADEEYIEPLCTFLGIKSKNSDVLFDSRKGRITGRYLYYPQSQKPSVVYLSKYKHGLMWNQKGAVDEINPADSSKWDLSVVGKDRNSFDSTRNTVIFFSSDGTKVLLCYGNDHSLLQNNIKDYVSIQRLKTTEGTFVLIEKPRNCLNFSVLQSTFGRWPRKSFDDATKERIRQTAHILNDLGVTKTYKIRYTLLTDPSTGESHNVVTTLEGCMTETL